MASTIKNFLIGIGYDYDNKGEKKIESGIDSIKSKALQLGAVVAGAFGIKSLTTDFADAKDKLGLFNDTFGSTVENIKALGEASAREGSSLEATLAALQSIEKTRAAIKKGGVGIFGEAGKALGDAGAVVDAENSLEAMLVIADQLQGLDQQGRINLAEAYGLDPEQLRFLSQGSKKVRQLMNDQKELNTVTRNMTDAAREWKRQTHDLGQNTEGLSNKISEQLLPELNDTLGGMNKWISVNRKMINSGVDTTLTGISDNFTLIAGTLGIVAASAAFGAIASLGGMIPLIGGLAVAFGALGMSFMAWAAAAFAAWQIGKKIGEKINENLVDDPDMHIGRGIAKGLSWLGVDSAQRALNMEAANNSNFNPLGVTSDIPTVPPEFMTPTVANDIPTVPVEFRNVIELDGKVISDMVNTELGKEVERSKNNITSTNGG